MKSISEALSAYMQAHPIDTADRIALRSWINATWPMPIPTSPMRRRSRPASLNLEHFWMVCSMTHTYCRNCRADALTPYKYNDEGVFLHTVKAVQGRHP